MSSKARWVTALLLACAGGCGHSLSPAAQLLDDAAIKISQGNRSDAEVVLKQALEKDPNLAWAHYNLASCLQARRAFKDAVAEYRRALELFGNDDRHARSACLYGIAVTLDDKNDFAEATLAYQAYLQFAGGAPEEANGATVARARLNVLSDASLRGLPAGQPLRAPIGAPLQPAPLPAADAAAPAPAPAAPPAAAPDKASPPKAKTKAPAWTKPAKGKPAPGTE